MRLARLVGNWFLNTARHPLGAHGAERNLPGLPGTGLMVSAKGGDGDGHLLDLLLLDLLRAGSDFPVVVIRPPLPRIRQEVSSMIIRPCSSQCQTAMAPASSAFFIVHLQRACCSSTSLKLAVGWRTEKRITPMTALASPQESFWTTRSGVVVSHVLAQPNWWYSLSVPQPLNLEMKHAHLAESEAVVQEKRWTAEDTRDSHFIVLRTPVWLLPVGIKPGFGCQDTEQHWNCS